MNPWRTAVLANEYFLYWSRNFSFPLPYSEEPSICFYPELDDASSHLRAMYFKINFPTFVFIFRSLCRSKQFHKSEAQYNFVWLVTASHLYTIGLCTFYHMPWHAQYGRWNFLRDVVGVSRIGWSLHCYLIYSFIYLHLMCKILSCPVNQI
jgi:hypothetical protein